MTLRTIQHSLFERYYMARSISKKTANKTAITKEVRPQRKIRIDDLSTLATLTQKQKDAVTSYRRNKNLLLHGIAGTGKTYLAMSLAFEEVLDPSNKYTSVVIVRSTVPTRDMGFLKGDDKEKIAVYESPYIALCAELFGISDAYECLKSQGAVQFISTAFIRGLTLNDSIVIVDEVQNLSFHELDSIITRLGKSSKIIFCGDYTQSDFSKSNERNGCLDFMKILKTMSHFDFVEFAIEDIVRGPLVKEYIVAKYKLGLHV
jgi:phosphate starvation-inducible protein PhoH